MSAMVHCFLCKITPGQWRWFLSVIGSVAVALGSLAVMVERVYAVDHDFIARAGVEIPALKIRADRNTDRINEVEKNVAILPLMQKQLDRIEAKLDERK